MWAPVRGVVDPWPVDKDTAGLCRAEGGPFLLFRHVSLASVDLTFDLAGKVVSLHLTMTAVILERHVMDCCMIQIMNRA